MADPRGLRMHGFTGKAFVRPGHIHGNSKAFIRGLENLAGIHIQHPSFGGRGHMGGRAAAHRHPAGTRHAAGPHHVGAHRHAGHRAHAVHAGRGASKRGGWGWAHGRVRHTGGRHRRSA